MESGEPTRQNILFVVDLLTAPVFSKKLTPRKETSASFTLMAPPFRR
jgi:hypothetical protein